MIFTFEQIKNILGLTKQQFDKICKKNNFEYKIAYTRINNEEKRLYETSSNQNIIRGCYFTNESTNKALELFNDENIDIHFKNLYKLRLFFYRNNQRIEKDFFNDDLIKKTLVCKDNKNNKYDLLEKYCDVVKWSKDVYFKFCTLQNVKNQIKNYYEDSYFVNSKTSEKSFHKQKILSVGVHTEKSLNKLNNKVNDLNENKRLYNENKDKASNPIHFIENACEESPAKPQVEENKITLNDIARSIEDKFIKIDFIIPITDYNSFCRYTRKYFEQMKNHYKTVNVWKNIVLFYKNSDIDSYIKDEFKKIKCLTDIYKTPIFQKEPFRYIEQSEDQLYGLYICEENRLAKIIEKENNLYNFNEFTEILEKIFDKYKYGTDDETWEYTYDEFTNIVIEELKELKEKNLSQQDWEAFCQWKDSIFYKKYKRTKNRLVKEEFLKYNQIDLLVFLLSKQKFDSREDLLEYVKNKVYYTEKINEQCPTMPVLLRGNNFNISLIKEKEYELSDHLLRIFDIDRVDFDIVNYNLKYLVYEVRNSIDHQKDDISILFEKEIKSIKLHPMQGGLDWKVYQGYLYKVKLKLMTIDEVKKKILTV